MITEDKVTEVFCIADDFCKFFDAMKAKYTLKPIGKYCCPLNFKMTRFSYPQRPSIGVADFFLEK